MLFVYLTNWQCFSHPTYNSYFYDSYFPPPLTAAPVKVSVSSVSPVFAFPIVSRLEKFSGSWKGVRGTLEACSKGVGSVLEEYLEALEGIRTRTHSDKQNKKTHTKKRPLFI